MSGARLPSRIARRGLTLIEALIASAILLMSVLALTTALAAGQAAAIEGQKLLLGAMAVDDLLSELWAENFNDLPKYHNATEPVGGIISLDGEPYPDAFWMLGRRVEVTSRDIKSAKTGVLVRGVVVRVTVFDADRDLVSAELFIAEPGES